MKLTIEQEKLHKQWYLDWYKEKYDSSVQSFEECLSKSPYSYSYSYHSYCPLYYQKHREKILALGRKYQHSEGGKRAKREYMKKRMAGNVKHRINRSIKSNIAQSLKGRKAGRHWEDLVGYTLKDLMIHLESQFDQKMNWDNYGTYWQIDHRRPKSWFSYKTTEDPEFKKCWALRNLQPLEAEKNNSKGNRYSD